MTHPDPAQPPPRPWADPATLRLAAHAVIVLAGAWYLLGQLADVLRPLLLALFLGYVLMPYYNRLRRHLPAGLAVALLVGATTAVLMGVASAVYVGVAGLAREEPELRARAVGLIRSASELVRQYAPSVIGGDDGRPAEEMVADRLTGQALRLVNVAALGFVEAATAGLYLLFLLLESSRFPDQVRAAYPADRAAHILHVFGRINAAIISYLKAKVWSSLLLAVPVWAVLAGFGVRFAALWAVVTFVSNFVPYLGTAVAYSLPVGFAFLQFDPGWRPVTVAVLVAACHAASSSVVEPTVLGRAVGLSPLVILAALSVWGLLWGLPGMFLAVPLTVVLVIVLDNVDVTRPLARLLARD